MRPGGMGCGCLTFLVAAGLMGWAGDAPGGPSGNQPWTTIFGVGVFLAFLGLGMIVIGFLRWLAEHS
jgi:hypothetical protein